MSIGWSVGQSVKINVKGEDNGSRTLEITVGRSVGQSVEINVNAPNQWIEGL